jgi:hypothetical protein
MCQRLSRSACGLTSSSSSFCLPQVMSGGRRPLMSAYHLSPAPSRLSIPSFCHRSARCRPPRRRGYGQHTRPGCLCAPLRKPRLPDCQNCAKATLDEPAFTTATCRELGEGFTERTSHRTLPITAQFKQNFPTTGQMDQPRINNLATFPLGNQPVRYLDTVEVLQFECVQADQGSLTLVASFPPERQGGISRHEAKRCRAN